MTTDVKFNLTALIALSLPNNKKTSLWESIFIILQHTSETHLKTW